MTGEERAAQLTASAAAFDRALGDAEAAQHQRLMDVLSTHQDTEYGRRFDFASIRSVADYRRRVPVIGYDQIRADVDRMVAGTANILVDGHPIFYATSTGSTGIPKRIPYHRATVDEYEAILGPVTVALERDHPGCTARVVHIVARFGDERSAAGTPIGQTTGFVRKHFHDLPAFSMLSEAIYECPDLEARHYAILRLALAESMTTLMCFYPTVLLALFRMVVEYAEPLIYDLAHGGVTAGPPLARALAGGAAPNRSAADRLRQVIAVHGRFAPEEHWPELAVLQVWKGGAARFVLGDLRDQCPTAAIRPSSTGASEGNLLVGLCDDWGGGVPALRSTFLEFLPAEHVPSHDAFVGVRELEEGVGYRIAVTNHRGLYRYLMEDVYRIEGWYRGVPVLQYQHRVGPSCSLGGERVTEAHVLHAVEAAVRATRAQVHAFQLSPELGNPPRYRLLIEGPPDLGLAVLDDLLREFSRHLIEVNPPYGQAIIHDRIAPAQLVVVAAGTFERLQRKTAERSGKSVAQIKVAPLSTEPLVLADGDIVRVVELR